MRAITLLTCVALSACAAPAWGNPLHPNADLQADTADCNRDAERVVRRNQLTSSHAAGCNTGRLCVTQAENERIKNTAEAQAAQKRCLVARGWRQPG